MTKTNNWHILDKEYWNLKNLLSMMLNKVQ